MGHPIFEPWALMLNAAKSFGEKGEAIAVNSSYAQSEEIEYRGRDENRPEGSFEIKYEIAAEDLQLTKSTVVICVTK